MKGAANVAAAIPFNTDLRVDVGFSRFFMLCTCQSRDFPNTDSVSRSESLHSHSALSIE